MQTKNQIKLFLVLLISLVLASGRFLNSAEASALSSDLSLFTLDEDPVSAVHSTDFILTLTPDPINQVTTSFDTDGQCQLGHNNKDFTSSGTVVTANNHLWFGLRAVDDKEYEGAHNCNISFSSVSSVDSQYSMPATVNYVVAINDNDPQVISSYSLSSLTLGRIQEGKSIVNQYQIDISHAPHYDVVITAITDNQCDLLVGTIPNQKRVKTLAKRFKAGSTAPIKFTLIPVDDNEFEGLHQCSVVHSASTADTDFSSVVIAPYKTTILDNDVNPNIPDEREYEGGLIYYRDANFDGIDDERQPGVVSFINQITKARQAILIVDKAQNLIDDCTVSKVPVSNIYDDSVGDLIDSKQGEVSFTVDCPKDKKFDVIWLLDKYDPASKDWLIYDGRESASLKRLDFKTIVYNLGDSYTSAIVVDFERDGLIRFIQSQPEQEIILPKLDQSLSANINNRRLNPIAIGTGVIAVVVLLWPIYRRYFSRVDTTKSRYPRIDRF